MLTFSNGLLKQYGNYNLLVHLLMNNLFIVRDFQQMKNVQFFINEFILIILVKDQESSVRQTSSPNMNS